MKLAIPTQRPTWAEIDLGAINFNLARIKKHLSPSVEVMAVVKSDAYGHGIIDVSRSLSKEDIALLGVATVDEAIHLRESCVKKPILVLGGILASQAEAVLDYNLTQMVCSRDVAKALEKSAKQKGQKANVHIKVDTGMGRLGVWHDDAVDFIKFVKSLKGLNLDGIFTHLSSADEFDKTFTLRQINCFSNLLDDLNASGIDFKYKHVSNSAGIVSFKECHFNLARPGIMMYGIYPDDRYREIIKLRPALSFRTRIIYLKDVPAGRAISYGRTHITKGAAKIATLPVGYGDGYPRHLSNKASVLVNGKRAPIVGRVCMDLTMVDVSHIKDVKVGDEVVLIGRQGNDEITAQELARYAGTIPYEIVCWISKRVPRIYKQ